MKQTCIKRKFTDIRSFTLLILVLSKNTIIFLSKQNQSMANGENMTHWENVTVQSLDVVRLRIVYDNCDFTERSLVY